MDLVKYIKLCVLCGCERVFKNKKSFANNKRDRYIKCAMNLPEYKEKDLIRQKKLLDELNCQFYRIDQKTLSVYKVHVNQQFDLTEKIQETLHKFKQYIINIICHLT
jgi:hypothetical protein